MSISRPIYFKPVLWKPIQVDYFLQYFSTRDQCQQIDSEAGLLTRIFQEKMSRTQGWSGAGLQEYLTRSTTCQICSWVILQDQFKMDKSKLNWGLMSGIYPVVWPGRMYDPAGLGISLMTRRRTSDSWVWRLISQTAHEPDDSWMAPTTGQIED